MTTPTTTAAPAPAAQPSGSPAPAQPTGTPANAPPNGTPAVPGAETAPPTAPVDTPDGGSWSEPGSRSGDGSARKDHWAAARSVHGDQVHGDKVTGNKFELHLGGRKVLVRELSVDLADPVRYAFVKPGNWADLSARFRRQRMTIVRAPSGYGKDASAIRLLMPEVETIYHLDPQTDVPQLADSIGEQATRLGGAEGGIGFLLCQPLGAAQLRGYAFHALDRALEEARARLVITLPDGVLPADADLDPYILDLAHERVDGRQIVARHLSWRCNDDVAARLLASDSVQELLGELEDSTQACRAAAELAWIISLECTDDGTINAAAVRERQRRQGDEAFDRWFDGLRGAEERSFAIALAVLDGLSYEEVADAARRLRRRLEASRQLVVGSGTDGRSELGVAYRELLQTSTARLLDRVRAYQVDGRAPVWYGTVPVRTVRYHDPTYPLKVIERMWRGYQIQPVLLDWFSELVGGPSEPVRFYVASALGELARCSFDYLIGRLGGWANSKNYKYREAAAYALGGPAADPALADSVNFLVGTWYADRGMPLRQATAARAYGVGVGGLGTAATIDRLGRLATVENFTVASAIGDALADLMLDDPDEVAPMTCRELLGWFDEPLRIRPAQLAFIILATSLLTRPSQPGTDETGPPWPTLLWLLRSNPALRDPLCSLWRTVIGESVLYAEAQDALTSWAGLAENDPEQLDMFVRLVRAVATTDRTVAILTRVAGQWVAPDNLTPLPNAHEAVMAELTPPERS